QECRHDSLFGAKRRILLASRTASHRDVEFMNRRSLLLMTAFFVAAHFGPAVLNGQTAASTPASPAAKIRLACIGDSVTYGSGLAEREVTSYPGVLQKLLGDGYEVK